MAQPCIASSARIFKTRRCSVPCTRSVGLLMASPRLPRLILRGPLGKQEESKIDDLLVTAGFERIDTRGASCRYIHCDNRTDEQYKGRANECRWIERTHLEQLISNKPPKANCRDQAEANTGNCHAQTVTDNQQNDLGTLGSK